MSIVLTIKGIDRTDQVDWRSFKKTEVLSKEPDILDFRIKNTLTKTFRPDLNDEIIVTLNGTRIFGGNIVETREVIDGKLRFFQVMCKDFTFLLDRTLVKRRFQSTTADAIIATIVTDFVEAGFTTTNVVAPTPIEDINFNHFYVSDALQKLADYIGYEWYVDYDKDIHFFLTDEGPAPFNLDETGGKFNWNTLRVSESIHQIRNKVIVRGGTIVGSSTPKKFKGNGEQSLFHVGDRHIDMTVKLDAVTKTLGKEGIDDDDVSIATLYNPNSGYVKFKTVPADGEIVEITSKPTFALIKVFKDNTSIAQFGEFEYVIVDKQIKSTEAAASRARGELLKWADQIREGSFITHEDGLRVGQKLTITIPFRSISQTYVINRITTRTQTPLGDLTYEVILLASEQMTMIDILSDLLINRPLTELDILEDEIVDLIVGAEEGTVIDFGEVFNATTVRTPAFVEAIDMGEAVVTTLNLALITVYGPFLPSGNKRQGHYDGAFYD